MYHPSGENKGADQLCSYCTADLRLCFRICKLLVSHAAAQIIIFLDPVVQSIVSLTISLRHKFVKQMSAKVTNTLLFFVEKM